MKKIYLLSFCCLLLLAAKNTFAQSVGAAGNPSAAKTPAAAPDTARPTVHTAEDLKSGNWQDVMSSFFQLAAGDLTGPNRSIKFQSTLFAVKTRMDSTLVVDTNYVRQRFSRNFQFNFALGLDSNFNLKGFSGGFTWAAVNKRDSTLISFVGTPTDIAFAKYAGDFANILFGFDQVILDSVSGKPKPEYKALADSLANALHPGLKAIPLPARFVQYLKANHYDTTAYAKVQADYQKALADARLAPLLTFSVNSAFQKNARFDSVRLDAVYLQGITGSGRPLELDLRASGSLKDSAVAHDHYRGRVTLTGGMNYALVASHNKKTDVWTPLVEIKPYAEYDGIFTARLPNEKQNTFYASMDIRVRITDALWLPITLKYDVNQKNLFGFLNLSLNMSAFRSQGGKKAS